MTKTSDQRDDFGTAPDQGKLITDFASYFELAAANYKIWSKNSKLADYKLWSKAPRWTIEEATALSFGVEPTWVEWATVN